MTAHAAIAAVPKTGQPNRTLLQALLVSRVAYIIGSGEDPEAFDPRGEDSSPTVQVIGYNGLWFWLDEADATTGHDGTTCIVPTATGGRYKVTGVDLLITHVISKTLTTPPDPDDVDEELRPDDGDAYIVPAASTGDWSTWAKSIAVWVEARREWFRILPKPGWFVWIAGATQDTAYHYDSVQADWIAGLGGGLLQAASVPLSAIIGMAASATIRVENQTTYAPPGSRKTGATPAMPLGGTASNINDNSDTTTAVTSALGNLTGAAVADRIIAKLTLAAATDLIYIEARGVLGSAASSATAMGLYWSDDSGASWTQAGAGFTLSTSSQNVQRTGSFAGVTDIALVTEAKNWSSNTNTLAGLNAFDATVDAAVGDAYIIGISIGAFGIFAGHGGKVAICEVVDTFTIYTPATGDRVWDKSLGQDVRWNGTAWASVVGAILATGTVYANDAGSSNFSATGSGVYTPYAASTAPAGQLRDLDAQAQFTLKSDYVGQRFRFEYECDALVSVLRNTEGGTTAGVTVALYRDSDVTALDWRAIATTGFALDIDKFRLSFEVTADDAASHTYKVAFMHVRNGTQRRGVDHAYHRRFSYQKFA